jgi:hypothetical protein
LVFQPVRDYSSIQKPAHSKKAICKNFVDKGAMDGIFGIGKADLKRDDDAE